MKKYILLLAGLVLLGNAVQAQQTGRKYVSARGESLVAMGEIQHPTYAQRMDMDADGQPDIISLHEDTQGTTTSLKIVNAASRVTVIELSQTQLVELFGGGQLRVLGFVDLDGDAARELAVLKRSPERGRKADNISLYAEYSAQPEAARPDNDSLFVMNIAGHALSIRQVFPARFSGHANSTDIRQLSTFGLSDQDGDGSLDLMLGDEQAGVVEIWGAEPELASEAALLADGAHLFQNFPNPFSGNTAITYQVEENDQVQLRIYDVLGREVRSLIDASQAAGVHTVEWDGRDESGAAVTAGVYFYKLQIGDFTTSRQMIRVK